LQPITTHKVKNDTNWFGTKVAHRFYCSIINNGFIIGKQASNATPKSKPK
jgi:hypothetical protein